MEFYGLKKKYNLGSTIKGVYQLDLSRLESKLLSPLPYHRVNTGVMILGNGTVILPIT